MDGTPSLRRARRRTVATLKVQPRPSAGSRPSPGKRKLVSSPTLGIEGAPSSTVDRSPLPVSDGQPSYQSPKKRPGSARKGAAGIESPNRSWTDSSSGEGALPLPTRPTAAPGPGPFSRSGHGFETTTGSAFSPTQRRNLGPQTAGLGSPLASPMRYSLRSGERGGRLEMSAEGGIIGSAGDGDICHAPLDCIVADMTASEAMATSIGAVATAAGSPSRQRARAAGARKEQMLSPLVMSASASNCAEVDYPMVEATPPSSPAPLAETQPAPEPAPTEAAAGDYGSATPRPPPQPLDFASFPESLPKLPHVWSRLGSGGRRSRTPPLSGPSPPPLMSGAPLSVSTDFGSCRRNRWGSLTIGDPSQPRFASAGVSPISGTMCSPLFLTMNRRALGGKAGGEAGCAAAAAAAASEASMAGSSIDGGGGLGSGGGKGTDDGDFSCWSANASDGSRAGLAGRAADLRTAALIDAFTGLGDTDAPFWSAGAAANGAGSSGSGSISGGAGSGSGSGSGDASSIGLGGGGGDSEYPLAPDGFDACANDDDDDDTPSVGLPGAIRLTFSPEAMNPRVSSGAPAWAQTGTAAGNSRAFTPTPAQEPDSDAAASRASNGASSGAALLFSKSGSGSRRASGAGAAADSQQVRALLRMDDGSCDWEDKEEERSICADVEENSDAGGDDSSDEAALSGGGSGLALRLGACDDDLMTAAASVRGGDGGGGGGGGSCGDRGGSGAGDVSALTGPLGVSSPHDRPHEGGSLLGTPGIWAEGSGAGGGAGGAASSGPSSPARGCLSGLDEVTSSAGYLGDSPGGSMVHPAAAAASGPGTALRLRAAGFCPSEGGGKGCPSASRSSQPNTTAPLDLSCDGSAIDADAHVPPSPPSSLLRRRAGRARLSSDFGDDGCAGGAGGECDDRSMSGGGFGCGLFGSGGDAIEVNGPMNMSASSGLSINVSLASSGGSSASRPMPDQDAFEPAQSQHRRRRAGSAVTAAAAASPAPAGMHCPPTPVRTPSWAHDAELSAGLGLHRRASSLRQNKVLACSSGLVSAAAAAVGGDGGGKVGITGAAAGGGDADRNADDGGGGAAAASAAVRAVEFARDFVSQGRIGEGAFAVVFRATCKADGGVYAIKKSKRPFRSRRDRERCMMEVRTLQRLGTCPYIVRFDRAWQEDGFFYCQTELCELGNLKEFIEAVEQSAAATSAAGGGSRHSSIDSIGFGGFGGGAGASGAFGHRNSSISIGGGGGGDLSTGGNSGSGGSLGGGGSSMGGGGGGVPEATLWKICHDIVEGLYHIHRHGLVHLDIKPSNIFLSGCGRLKIGDFGMATAYGQPAGEGNEGDTFYLARELLDSDERLPPADMFSLGITLYEIAAGVELPGGGAAWHNLREGRAPPLPPGRSPTLVAVVGALMRQEPGRRLPAAALRALPSVAAVGDPDARGAQAPAGGRRRWQRRRHRRKRRRWRRQWRVGYFAEPKRGAVHGSGDRDAAGGADSDGRCEAPVAILSNGESGELKGKRVEAARALLDSAAARFGAVTTKLVTRQEGYETAQAHKRGAV
ncbi:unnamed protein product [Phaeothamnion confervicola]